MLSGIRQYFAAQNYMEVETPLMSRDVVVDAHLDPFECTWADTPYFLQTSPEAGMKRLLAAGSGSIFQITRSFRNHEVGRHHNPEFTMVEWYGVDTTFADQLQFTEGLVHAALQATSSRGWNLSGAEFLNQSFTARSYCDAFLAAVGVDPVDASVEELCGSGAKQRLTAGTPRDEILNLLLADAVEPMLGQQNPEFLTHYPAAQAALAQVNPADPRTSLRFELYVHGVELCNGYQELTDSSEMKDRESAQNQIRLTQNRPALPGAPRLLEAMQCGLPACAGVALGFDRLVLTAIGSQTLAEAMPFPVDIA